MKSDPSTRAVLLLLLLSVAAVAPVLLSGCGGNAYSASMEYGVRTDPLVIDEKLGPDRMDPEPPGQLPLLAPADLRDPRSPLHADGEALFKSGKLRDPNRLNSADRRELEAALKEVFGTPARPKVAEISEEEREVLRLDDKTLAEGSRLFRIHCLHCHGVTGDGRGPTARWVHPHPRDYRQGLFKFQSVDQSDGKVRPPRRADLLRTVELGIEGTSMPSFALLPQEEKEAMVSYVIHLSIRGQAEFETLKSAFSYDPASDSLKRGEATPAEEVKANAQDLARGWAEAQNKPIPVKPSPYKDEDLAASVRRGQALFLADEASLKKYYPKVDINALKGASCVSCHLGYGRKALYKFDSWGTLVRPANLTTGVYRGGRRPEDQYHRIHSGINGSGMPPFGKTLDNNQIWDLINFVRALPYPAMREKYGIQVN